MRGSSLESVQKTRCGQEVDLSQEAGLGELCLSSSSSSSSFAMHL